MFVNRERKYLTQELKNLGLSYTLSTTTNLLVNIEKMGNVGDVIQKLKQKGVLVTNGTFFRVPENKYIRVAISSKDENQYFIKVIKEMINK